MPRPYLLPLGSRSQHDSNGLLLLALVKNSPILGLVQSLGSSLDEIRLRFANVFATGVGELELRKEGPGDPYETTCSIVGDELQCWPWPEVPATHVVGNHKYSALTVLLQAPPTSNIPSSSLGQTSAPGPNPVAPTLELTLNQRVEFFQNIKVISWFPNGDLVETIEEMIVIEGENFVDSASLRCLFFVEGAGVTPLSELPALFESDTRVKCSLPPDTFRQTSKRLSLHLSLDGGQTYEQRPVGTGTMSWSLRRAPLLSGLQARDALGKPATLSTLIGRTSVLSLYIKGIHFDSAEGRDPICKFTVGGGL